MKNSKNGPSIASQFYTGEEKEGCRAAARHGMVFGRLKKELDRMAGDRIDRDDLVPEEGMTAERHFMRRIALSHVLRAICSPSAFRCSGPRGALTDHHLHPPRTHTWAPPGRLAQYPPTHTTPGRGGRCQAPDNQT